MCSLLAEHGDEAKPLAGGQSLVPMLALRLARFEHLVDLNRVRALDGVERADGHLVVRACTRQRTIEHDATVAAAAPLLARATPLIGHFQIRNRGTVGGSLAHADPASEYPAVALALGAELELTSSTSRRNVPAAEFFVGTWTTAAHADELLTAVHIPEWDGPRGFAIEEVARRLGDFALVGVACALAARRAHIALFGVGGTPVRAHLAEDAALAGASESDVAEAAARELDPVDDIHASAATRRRIARHLVERAVAKARRELRDAA